MADFSHLQQTMTNITSPERRKSTSGTGKKKKKKSVDGAVERTKSTSHNGTSITNGHTGEKPKKKSSVKKTESQNKPPPPTSKVNEIATKSKNLNSRLGPVIKQTKEKKKHKEVLSVVVDKEREKKSKIWQALNPQPLYQRNEEEETEVELIGVRGTQAIDIMEMEDKLHEKDEFGNLILEEEDDEDITGFDDDDDDELADFDEETKKMMMEKRAQREKEAEERRKLLRKNSMEKKSKEDAKNAKILADIEKKEAKLNKKKEISNKFVQESQKRLAKELEFDFGFH